MMRIRGRRAGQQNWALPFLAGIFAGAAGVYLNRSSFLTENGFLSRMSLERIGRLDLNHTAFFLYVLGKRLKFLWLSAVLATTFAGIVTTYLLILWVGVCGGVIMCAAILRYGLKGFLLLAGGGMPQFLFYAPAFVMLAGWCIQTCLKLYYPVMDYTEVHTKKWEKTELLGKLLLIHIVVIIGAFLESYVNPNLMSELLKIF